MGEGRRARGGWGDGVVGNLPSASRATGELPAEGYRMSVTCPLKHSGHRLLP